MTPRFTRHFNILCIPSASEVTLTKIFSSILNGFFNLGFAENVKRTADIITASTIEVYKRISLEKLPIPSKFHYTFNLRDVSKVFQGILMVKNATIRDEQQASRLWLHEVSRVFYDRLINEEDRKWFKEMAMDLLGRRFSTRQQYEDLFDKNRVVFSDIMRLEMGKEYEEIKDFKKLIKTLEGKQDDYNYENASTKMFLVFFDDCIDHIMRLLRILRQPRGNAMLIGVGGSGK